jgi:protein-L-isoaspartate O-methyltransferase
MRQTILGSDPVEDLALELPPTDWSYLDRYRDRVRSFASQIEVYLSRGCPFDCAFCMERAKRVVSWPPLPGERALDEVLRAHAYFDLRGMTVYFADALFGMRKAWRREFLERLAALDLPAKKLWLLVRVDMIDEEDLTLFGRANCSLGFGLESGDPTQLATIRKAGRLHDYLDKMLEISAKAREAQVPWGANVIVGHPGETEESMRTSARYLERLFLDPAGVTGFLSVDPYRLYPGSPIDDDRASWEQRHGTVFHRPEWWHDGDQEFLSEWVDPSATLDYRRRAALTDELFAPILRRLEANYRYAGPARDYFLLAIREQVEQFSSRTQLHYADRFYAWNRYLGRKSEATLARLADEHLARTCHAERATVLDAVLTSTLPERESASAQAIETALRGVRRELFVPLDAVKESVSDHAIGLDDSGDATVSAMHAYARTFYLGGVRPGLRVLDLGGGTGYGAALLGAIVGERGSVVSVELDSVLVERGRGLLPSNVTLLAGDCLEPSVLDRAARQGKFDVVVAGFAVTSLPVEVGAVLEVGGCLVVPLDHDGVQHLTRARWSGSSFVDVERWDTVRYVRTRHDTDLRARSERTTSRATPAAARPAASPKRLRVLPPEST